MSPRNTGYIPTVGGHPARFDGYQLCVGGGRGFKVVVLPSLRAVRQQIEASIRNRKRDKLDADRSDYGYVLVSGAR